eukprot:5502_1
MADANVLYLQYLQEFGYPPKAANHLTAFATQNNQHLTWKDANNAIKNPPASQNLQQQKKSQHKYNNNAKINNNENKQNDNNDNLWSQYKDRNNGCEPDNAYQLMMFTMKNSVRTLNEIEATRIFQKNKKFVSKSKHKRTASVPSKTYASIVVNYDDGNYVNKYIIPLDLSKKQYTITDLRKDVIRKNNTNEASLLIFKLDSNICNHKMDIISHCKSNKIKRIIFDVELFNQAPRIQQAKSATKIIREHGITINKLISKIKEQFNAAYFTKHNNNYDEEKQDLNEGKWDKNLNEGISTLISSQQNQMFDEIVEKFENKVKETLNQHKELENKITHNPNDKQIIKQQLDNIMNDRKNKINKQYEIKLKKLTETHKKMNHLWDKTQQKTLECYKRKQYQEAQIEKEREKIDKEREKR